MLGLRYVGLATSALALGDEGLDLRLSIAESSRARAGTSLTTVSPAMHCL